MRCFYYFQAVAIVAVNAMWSVDGGDIDGEVEPFAVAAVAVVAVEAAAEWVGAAVVLTETGGAVTEPML